MIPRRQRPGSESALFLGFIPKPARAGCSTRKGVAIHE